MNAVPCISDFRPGDEFGNGPHALLEDYTHDDAQADAEAEMDRDPYSLAWWLGEQTPTPGPVDLGIAADRLDAGLQVTVPELLALAFCDQQRAIRALHLLREAYRADPKVTSDTQIRASELYDAANPGTPELDDLEDLPWN